MVYLPKKDADRIIKELSNIQNKEIKNIIRKLKNPEKKLTYITEQPKIKALLKRAFKEKRKVKITYYSLSSDEVTNRIIDIYQLHNDCVVAFCNLRDDERTFVMSRINKAAILDEKYSIPKGWSPESIILNN